MLFGVIKKSRQVSRFFHFCQKTSFPFFHFYQKKPFFSLLPEDKFPFFPLLPKKTFFFHFCQKTSFPFFHFDHVVNKWPFFFFMHSLRANQGIFCQGVNWSRCEFIISRLSHRKIGSSPKMMNYDILYCKIGVYPVGGSGPGRGMHFRVTTQNIGLPSKIDEF